MLGAVLAAFAIGASASGLSAQQQPAGDAQDVLKYANGNYLAFVKSPADTVNNNTLGGMQALQEALTKRTSLDPEEEIVALDLETDNLAPFQFILFPITDDTQPLSKLAQSNLQSYINARKMLIIDIRSNNRDDKAILARVLGDVDLGILEPMRDNHPLTEIFYRSGTLPGSLNVTPVQVKVPSASVSEDIASVIVGRRDWARAWAGTTVSDDAQEQAIRAIVNVAVAAYTGNYKPDQQRLDEAIRDIRND